MNAARMNAEDLDGARMKPDIICYATGDSTLGNVLLAQSARGLCAILVGLDQALDVGGTPFQQRVWQALRAIPAVSTASYTDIAGRIGQPHAVRAVAGACAANVLAVAIPCHRVIRSDGSLSGYRCGLQRKHELLQREGRP